MIYRVEKLKTEKDRLRMGIAIMSRAMDHLKPYYDAYCIVSNREIKLEMELERLKEQDKLGLTSKREAG